MNRDLVRYAPVYTKLGKRLPQQSSQRAFYSAFVLVKRSVIRDRTGDRKTANLLCSCSCASPFV